MKMGKKQSKTAKPQKKFSLNLPYALAAPPRATIVDAENHNLTLRVDYKRASRMLDEVGVQVASKDLALIFQACLATIPKVAVPDAAFYSKREWLERTAQLAPDYGSVRRCLGCQHVHKWRLLTDEGDLVRIEFEPHNCDGWLNLKPVYRIPKKDL